MFRPNPLPVCLYRAAIDVLKQKNSRLADFNVSKILDTSFVKSAQDRRVGG
jgi:hypothetical protein